MKPIPNPYRTGECFFCGLDNPIGLKLDFFESETNPPEVVLNWHASSKFRGFGNILHGGIQSGIFDEIMGWATIHFMQQVGVTIDLQVKFLRPVYVDQDIEARCRIASRNGSRICLEAEIVQDGKVCTSATGSYLLMEKGKFDKLIKPD